MRTLIAGLLGVWLVSVMGTPAGAAGEAEMVERMRGGGHILMIRHALAPGTGDPATFRLGDCATQRTLSDEGRAQARAIGDWLRARGIAEARVYSSQWCRCLETAELLALGPVTELPGLNSFYERPQDREPNLRALESFIAAQPADGPLIVMVTHYVTIAAVTGGGTRSGGGMLIDLTGASDRGAAYSVVGRLDLPS